MVSEYAAGRSSKAIADEYHVSIGTLLNYARAAGVPVKSSGRPLTSFTADQLLVISDAWKAGYSAGFISTALGFKGQYAVRVALAELGLEYERRFNTASGEDHGNWKGGVTKTKKGYVTQVIDPSHPWYEAMVHDRKKHRVLQHRWVMAETLGRPLLRSETVHHKDGVHDHNDPSNLQLRNGVHGQGTIMVCNTCGSHDVSPAPLPEED